MTSSVSTPLAVFDLDGTLTTRDSFVAYLVTFGRRHARYRALASMPLWMGAYAGKLMKDYQLKQRLIRSFVSGIEPGTVREHTQWFCQHWLPRHLHPIGYRLLQQHLHQRHRVILLSASPEIFVPAVAEALGIKEVVCTRVKQIDGVWQGELDGLNCKGEEKLASLQRYLGSTDKPSGSYSYGDSKSDLAVLSWVEHGAWIRRGNFFPLDGADRSMHPWDAL